MKACDMDYAYNEDLASDRTTGGGGGHEVRSGLKGDEESLLTKSDEKRRLRKLNRDRDRSAVSNVLLV